MKACLFASNLASGAGPMIEAVTHPVLQLPDQQQRCHAIMARYSILTNLTMHAIRMIARLCRGKEPRTRFTGVPHKPQRAQTFHINDAVEGGVIRAWHTHDALPMSGVTRCLTASSGSQSFSVVLRHSGLQPGPASVHVVNQQAGPLCGQLPAAWQLQQARMLVVMALQVVAHACSRDAG